MPRKYNKLKSHEKKYVIQYGESVNFEYNHDAGLKKVKNLFEDYKTVNETLSTITIDKDGFTLDIQTDDSAESIIHIDIKNIAFVSIDTIDPTRCCFMEKRTINNKTWLIYHLFNCYSSGDLIASVKKIFGKYKNK